jgi:hypothetical protein
MEAQAAQIVALREAHALAVAVIEKSPNQSTPTLQQPTTQGLGQGQVQGMGQGQVVGQGLGLGHVQGMGQGQGQSLGQVVGLGQGQGQMQGQGLGQGQGQVPNQAALSINDFYRCVHVHSNPFHHLITCTFFHAFSYLTLYHTQFLIRLCPYPCPCLISNFQDS